jgi:MFS family permease
MLAALLLPKLLDNRPDRPVMICGALVLVTALLTLSLMALVYETQWIPLLAGWFIIGIGYSAVLTPSGRLLKRSAHAEDRPTVYATQFALSHVCWLVTYPLAGWLITVSGPTVAFGVLAVLAGAGVVCGIALWPQESGGPVTHSHDDLPKDHPHVQDGQTHSHPIVIDDYHPHWPRMREVDSGIG